METKMEMKEVTKLIWQIRDRMKQEVGEENDWAKLYRENKKLAQLCQDIDEICMSWASKLLARITGE